MQSNFELLAHGISKQGVLMLLFAKDSAKLIFGTTNTTLRQGYQSHQKSNHVCYLGSETDTA